MAGNHQKLIDYLRETLGDSFSEAEERQLLAYLEKPHEQRIPLWNANSVTPARDATEDEITALRHIED